jgi:hypothetical protein
VYQTVSGDLIEVSGFNPDVVQTVFPLTDRLNGIDSGLDSALMVLASQGIY